MPAEPKDIPENEQDDAEKAAMEEIVNLCRGDFLDNLEASVSELRGLLDGLKKEQNHNQGDKSCGSKSKTEKKV